ncbi:hypothetical protein HKD37_07G018842 [Glycine soja]
MSFLSFWSTITNTFVFPFGFPMTTLHDVVTIFGLSIVNGEIPSLHNQTHEDLGFSFDNSTNGYPHFILYMKTMATMSTPNNQNQLKRWIRCTEDPTLGESLLITSTISNFTHFFIKAIFGILDDLKSDPPSDLETKAIQSHNRVTSYRLGI